MWVKLFWKSLIKFDLPIKSASCIYIPVQYLKIYQATQHCCETKWSTIEYCILMDFL